MNLIADDFTPGTNLIIGKLVIIEPDVRVGNNVKIGHRVTLKSGTRIGNDSIIDDHCITTGACLIGNNVNIRTGAIISRATIIEDLCFVGPGVVTNHTKHVSHGRETAAKSNPLITYIGYGSIIGSQASILAGVYIGPQSIVGGGSVGTKDLPGLEVYVGCPWKSIGSIPSNYILKSTPENAGRMYHVPEVMTHLVSYMPNLDVKRLAEQVGRFN